MRKTFYGTATCTLATALMLAAVGAGCETIRDNPRATGALAGAGAGALAGSAIAGKGNKTEGAAIGAAAGAGGGWLIGDQVDKNSDNDRDRTRARRARARDRYDDDYYDRRDSRYRDYN